MTDRPKPDRPVMISVNGVGKSFKLPHEKTTSIKGAVINSWRKRRTYEIQTALKNISFEVPKGEFLGIVGRNGSGKSTLLKLLAGIYTPNKGTIDVKGSLTPFIELGVGFNPELTGRENVFLNGALLGFSRKEMASMYQEIVDFAELERFMDQKLKNYSSGMQVRLAFSIAIQAKTDILLIDEVLAVGDAIFQQKCYDYFDKLKNSDTTVVFISHDMGAIQAFCDRAILIDDSKVVMEGQPVEVTQKYSQILAAGSKVKYTDTKLQHTGVGTAEILGASILDSNGKVAKSIEEGEPFTVRVEYRANKAIEDPVFGVGIMGEKGNSLIGPNTKEAKVHTGIIKKGKGKFEVSFKNNILAPGSYRIRGAIFNTSNTVPYDFVEHLHVLTVTGKKRYGEVVLDAEWEVK